MPQPQEEIENKDNQAQSVAAPASSAVDTSAEKQYQPHKHHSRTRGLWAFDALLYPLLTNVAVFLISVYATYKTNFGKDGGWFKKRGDLLKGFMNRKFNWKPETTEMGVMVGFSFLDGSIMAPVIKMFEDRRGKISHWLDHVMGTEPKDAEVYKQEPKQSWISILGGRIATFALVFPTAYALDKHKVPGRTDGANWNDVLFRNSGKWVANKFPSMQRRFPGIKMEGLAATVAFEAFYTSLCTAGLYLWSRTIARAFGSKDKNAVSSVTTPQDDGSKAKQVESPLEENAVSWANTKVTPKSAPVKTENYTAGVDASRTGSTQSASL